MLSLNKLNFVPFHNIGMTFFFEFSKPELIVISCQKISSVKLNLSIIVVRFVKESNVYKNLVKSTKNVFNDFSNFLNF